MPKIIFAMVLEMVLDNETVCHRSQEGNINAMHSKEEESS